jgi:hypothetical protein
MNSKNLSLLTQFTNYCAEHPQERFWQALRNWSGYAFILGANGLDLETGDYKEVEDTFYK